ncbi:uncharacterized protein E0L32_003112 [Thyridium curvatum]|uniref:Uncharacterized protein n=1 Tax=Thyridium curvatum TaxID=1093900 RepID=A0A507BJ60_9PEZI|nr:uncharacterized protein E0L32_003112 [Thyridium curvatum]TPX17469.1 hypothetical protein E0L32_003112 [Thyridium curvatum]
MDLPSRLDQRPHRPASRNDFEIAILCALTLEADAVDHVFDHHWKKDGITYDKAPGDSNYYITGTIHRHNVVLAYMPDEGKVNGAVVATNCRLSFPNIRLALVVGVCAAVPFPRSDSTSRVDEIVLGDVIISNGVVEYDHGRMQPEGFKRKATVMDNLGRPNQEIRTFLRMLKGVRPGRELRQAMLEQLSRFKTEPKLDADYPGFENDRLFPTGYRHATDGKSCDEGGCAQPLVKRRRLQQPDVQPRVHIGLIASGDMVMKSSFHRDIIVEDEKVIAFEMESAGVWDVFPCVVIKGACDYADSHKTKGWQRYAAATAASCMKAFLGEWVPSNLQTIPAPAPSSSTVTAELSTAQPAVVTTKTVVFCVPLPVNPRFVGRTQILNELQTKLFDNDNGKIALVGLAGVGKTQIALQLAVYVRDNMQDRSVFWLSALSMPSFEQSCRLIMKQSGLKDSDSKDPKAIIQDYLSSERAGRWLLIVDNADDKSLLFGSDEVTECIKKHLPQSESGLMLFTTRSRQVASAAAQCAENIIPVLGMSDQEAREHLGKKTSSSELNRNEEATESLLQRLTNLPLAITQAAAYINENQISIATYLDLFDNTDAVQLISNHFYDDTRYKESDNAVATTLLVSFRQISETNELAARLLTFLA